MSAPHFEAPEIGEIQRLLPAYEILDFIAKGGMGAVYRGRQISLDRQVAIKILPREFGEQPEFRKSFETEAKAMARLNHPNLVGVYDFGEVEGMPYIVMEYVNGKALHYSAHGIAIEQIEAARLILGICEGLAHAHHAGILHRDIKPANILLDSGKQPKIGDFGLAGVLGSEDALLFGTPGYSSPETLSQPDKVDKRSDVFSIGVVLYELLTGKLPGHPFVPASLQVACDPSFDPIISRAIHPSPDQRFADAGTMSGEVRKLLENLSVPRNADGPAVKDRPTANRSPSAPRRTARARSPIRTMMRNLAIVVVLLGAIFMANKTLNRKTIEDDPRKTVPVADTATKKPEVVAEDKQVKSPESVTSPTPRVPVEAVQPVVREEAPLDGLARLRNALASGGRGDFPPGTRERGDLRYFLVETPMTWQDAGVFAENHGGHLATAPGDAELTWLASQVPASSMIWLGGASIGSEHWGWVDGSEWAVSKPSAGTGTSAALSANGSLTAQPAGEKHPFFIQWRMDGRNPGALFGQLQRTRESLGNPDPSYPPGTVSFEERHYLIVNRAATWDEAAALAAEGNGHLAVPAGRAENDFLWKEIRGSLGDGSSCWIGSKHDGNSFVWITGEPWNYAAWASGFPKPDVPAGSVVRLVPGPDGGWQHVDAGAPAGARNFIIEWSADHKARGVATAGAGELGDLREKAKDRIDELSANHQKEIRKNTAYLRDSLERWLKQQSKGNNARWARVIQAYLSAINDDGRFNVPARKLWPLETEPMKVVNACIVRQKSLDDDLRLDIEKLRLLYLQRLKELRDELLARGLKGLANPVASEIAACGNNVESFRQHLMD